MTDLRGRRVLVTGGTGFIGSALVRALVARGACVRCLDNQSRGAEARLRDMPGRVELMTGDVRDADAVHRAARGMQTVCHLAAVNGTEAFYEKPVLVLDVAVRGMLNVLDACLSEGIRDLVVASSSEVYQDAPRIPTPEDVPLVVPDVANPRYSYGAGKIISEVLAMNYGRTCFDRVLIVRPHNVYGPDMGAEHVIPQFALRMMACPTASSVVPFAIQGTGRETRAFIYIDDFTEGFVRVLERGEHRQVYNLGTSEEVTIAHVARLVAGCFGREIEIVPGAVASGSCVRRCPDITRLRGLGFTPRTSLGDGIAATVAWYRRGCAV